MPEEERQRLLTRIESKLDEKPTKSFGSSGLHHHYRHGGGGDGKVIVTNGMQPTLEYEQLRRRIRSNIMEMYNYVGTELTKMWKRHAQVPEFGGDYMERVMQMTTEQKRALLNDMDEMQRIDGYEQWRRQEAESLSDLVQRRLTHLQNPEDCGRARKLVCRLNKVRIFWNINFWAPTQLIHPFFFHLTGMRLRMSIASCCLLFYHGICHRTYINTKIQRMALPQKRMGRGV